MTSWINCCACKMATRTAIIDGFAFCGSCGRKRPGAGETAERPTCKTCPYYDAIIEMGAPAIKKIGGCRWDPNLIPHKRTDEWCGQHPDFPEYIAGLKKS